MSRGWGWMCLVWDCVKGMEFGCGWLKIVVRGWEVNVIG